MTVKELKIHLEDKPDDMIILTDYYDGMHSELVQATSCDIVSIELTKKYFKKDQVWVEGIHIS